MASNKEVSYYIRNQNRGNVKFGIDLRGGHEFIVVFDTKDIDNIEKTRDDIITVIRKRIDRYGVTEPEIRPAGPNRISIITPSVDPAEIASVRKLIYESGRLEFRIVHQENDDWLTKDKQPPYNKVDKTDYEKIPLQTTDDFGNTSTSYLWVETKDAMVTGDDVKDAFPTRSEFGAWNISMQFNGSARMGELTSKNIGRRMAVVLDGVAKSAPTIQGTFSSSGQITGNFTQQEASQLSIVISGGSLATALNEDAGSENSTDPTLGASTISAGKFACVLGMGLMLLFMIIYYRFSGFIAVIALTINILLIFGTLPILKAALTLPGIAGILLTIGMAVDANVLIFERIREEIRNGKNIITAIRNGYGRAFITILDANLTTLFTAFFLFKYGSGPIKGFAVTLSVGILASMFTALFITRWIFDFLAQLKILTTENMSKFMPSKKEMGKEIQFVKYRMTSVILSSLLIITAIASLTMRGKTALNVDLTGGTKATLTYQDSKKAPDIDDVSAFIKELDYKNPRCSYKGFGEAKVLEIVLQENIKDADQILSKKLNGKFASAGFGAGSTNKVGSLVGKDFRDKAMLSIFFALIAIILYISFRFEFSYALGAVAALIHDVLACMGIFLIFPERQISLTVVAAALTIIGYSLNDTIVVFDRMRENDELLRKKKNFFDIVNLSINQTLSRTVITSVTTLIVVISLLIFGGGAINDFAFLMCAGILVGTYSSIFVASPVMVYFHQRNAGSDIDASS
ncbi:MAG: protein translocase subunit SecD [Lentisphaeria bacterium]|nr:protein translocase subunit SecD [Lentisphaeria bacterium]